MIGVEEVLVLVVVGGASVGVALYLLGLVVYHAYRRGYNPVVWGLMAVVTTNPIFLLVVLVLVPNRARLRLREEFTADLDALLAAREPAPASPAGGPVPGGTVTLRPPPVGDATRTYRGDGPG